MKIKELELGKDNYYCFIHCPTLEDVEKVIKYLTTEEGFIDKFNLITKPPEIKTKEFCIVPCSNGILYRSSVSSLKKSYEYLPMLTVQDLNLVNLDMLMNDLDEKVANLEKKLIISQAQ